MDSDSIRLLTEMMTEIGTETRELIGDHGAVAVFRYAGMHMGKGMATGKSGDLDNARAVVEEFLCAKGFVDTVEFDGNIAAITNCRIARMLRERGAEPGEHPLCNFFFGVIDGVASGMTGSKVMVRFQSWDDADGATVCKEKW